MWATLVSLMVLVAAAAARPSNGYWNYYSPYYPSKSALRLFVNESELLLCLRSILDLLYAQGKLYEILMESVSKNIIRFVNTYH